MLGLRFGLKINIFYLAPGLGFEAQDFGVAKDLRLQHVKG